MHDLEVKNDARSMMKGSYQDHKLDKSNEINDRMTIDEKARDEFEKTIHNIGGANNGS